jgi:hypothetical protein
VFKFIFWVIKTGVLAIVVLVLSHWIEIQGRSISDHVKIKLSSARFDNSRLSPPALPELERIEKSERQKLRKLIEQLNQ